MTLVVGPLAGALIGFLTMFALLYSFVYLFDHPKENVLPMTYIATSVFILLGGYLGFANSKEYR